MHFLLETIMEYIVFNTSDAEMEILDLPDSSAQSTVESTAIVDLTQHPSPSSPISAQSAPAEPSQASASTSQAEPHMSSTGAVDSVEPLSSTGAASRSSTPTVSQSSTPKPGEPNPTSTSSRSARKDMKLPAQVKVNKLFEVTLLQPRRNKLDDRIAYFRENLNAMRKPKGFFRLNIAADVVNFLDKSGGEVPQYIPDHIGNRTSHLEAKNVFMSNTFDNSFLRCNQAYLLDLVEEELAPTFSTRVDFLLILKRIMAHLDLLVNILRRDVGLNTVKFNNNQPGDLSRVEIYIQLRYNEAYRATRAHVEAVNTHIPYKLTPFHITALSSTTKELFKSFSLAYNLDKGMV